MNIYDIAERSGVSIATVSRVINGTAPVGEKTKAKVLKVIEETGFTPNSFARGLNFNSMRLIGVLCTDFGDFFFSRAVSHLESLLRAEGFNVLLINTGYTIEGKKQGLSDLVEKNVDAIVLIGTVFKENDNSHIEEVAKRIPVFTVNSLIDVPNVYGVKCDEEKATEEAISTLIAEGYRAPLYLYENDWYGNVDKLRGLDRALTSAGIENKEAFRVKVSCSAPDVEDALLPLIANGKPLFDSVMASNDVLAVYTSKILRKYNIDCPLIGFNNSYITTLATPELTSVDNMLGDMCKTIASRVVDVLEGKEPPRKTLLSGTLIRRESF